MARHLHTDLSDLELLLSRQSAEVENMVLAGYRALHERSVDAAGEVMEQEALINQTEVAIEEHCLELLALHQPVAIDLRRVAAILKINSDLERIADLAVNITERAQSLQAFPQITALPRLEHMLELVLDMLRDAHAAFIRVDEKLAKSVCDRDDQVDLINQSVIADLVEKMQEAPENVAGYLHVFSVSRIIERIGDHATNIAEDVIYLANGKIARHSCALSGAED